ncbi:hypothetical protein ASPZODRAFT_132608, partial [Penicilliopsis zonata CBS 506.65]
MRQAKACVGCRQAKARCSLAVPCKRCVDRRLECCYSQPRPRSRHTGFRPIRPADGLDRAAQPVRSDLAMIPDVSLQNQPSPFHLSCHLVPDMPFSFQDLLSPGFHDLMSLSSTSDSQLTLTTTKTLLLQRERSLQQGSLTANMLFSRLTDYARMMVDHKTLPPFIYPPCSLGAYQCPSDTPHQCLPEALAVCSNLVYLFYQRIPGSHASIWNQIRAHLAQLRDEVRVSDL